MKSATKRPFASSEKFFFGLFLSLLLAGCGGNEKEAKEIERLREEVARLKGENGLLDSKGDEADPDASGEQSTGRVSEGEEHIDHMVELPVHARNQTLTQSTSTLAKINIRPSGAYVVMGKQFTEEQVSEWLTAKFDKTPNLKVLIRCDIDTKHLYLANVLSICRHVGVPKANIALKTEK